MKIWAEDFVEYHFMNILENKSKGDNLMHMVLKFLELRILAHEELC